MNYLLLKQKSNRVCFSQVTDFRRMLDAGGSEVRKGHKSKKSGMFLVSGRLEKVGHPMFLTGLDVRKVLVVRWVEVSARFQIWNTILGGN